jgi:hypothetical protein
VPVDRLARFIEARTGRITPGERDVTVQERSDRGNGTRCPIIYCHSALNDWKTPARDPLFMLVPGTKAVVDTVFDYALASLRFSIVSSEYRNPSPSSSNGWGNHAAVTKMEAARGLAVLPGDAQGEGGMGAKDGKVLLVGYSHGAPLAMGYLREHVDQVIGALLFAPAYALDQLRGPDGDHAFTATTGTGSTTTQIVASSSVFLPVHGDGNHFVIMQAGADVSEHLVTGYVSPTAVNVTAFGTAQPAGRGFVLGRLDHVGGFYEDINNAYLNDPLNPSPGTPVDDAAWAVIRQTADASFFDWTSLGVVLPPVLVFGSDDDNTVGSGAQQRAVTDNYGPRATYVDLPTPGGHFSGAFANDPYASQIHAFIDSLTF